MTTEMSCEGQTDIWATHQTKMQQMNETAIDLENYDFEQICKDYEGLDPVGYELLICIYTPKVEEKTKGGIFLSTSIIENQNADYRFTNQIGLIVKKGQGVYKDGIRYQYTGDFAQIGDWVCFSRHSGTDAFSYNGRTTCWLKEDLIRGKVKNPGKIQRLTK